MTKLGVGIIGCGGISNMYLRLYTTHFVEEARLLAFCDVVEEKARQRAEQARAAYREKGVEVEPRVYPDYHELLKDERVEVVLVTTPPPFHPPPAIAAMEAGKHVFCEGPMAHTLRDADAMIAAAQRAGVKFHVQYVYRFPRACQQARRAVASGKLGSLLMARVDCLWYRGQEYYDHDAWRGTPEGEGGGALFHHGRYIVDVFLWVVNVPVVEVCGYTATLAHRIEVEDCAMAALKFANGALGQVTASTAAHPNPLAPSNRVEIWGDKASLVLNDRDGWTLALGSATKGYADEVKQWLDEQVPPLTTDIVSLQTRTFLDAAHGKGEVSITGESARRQVELTRAIYRSVATRAPVGLPLTEGDP